MEELENKFKQLAELKKEKENLHQEYLLKHEPEQRKFIETVYQQTIAPVYEDYSSLIRKNGVDCVHGIWVNWCGLFLEKKSLNDIGAGRLIAITVEFLFPHWETGKYDCRAFKITTYGIPKEYYKGVRLRGEKIVGWLTVETNDNSITFINSSDLTLLRKDLIKEAAGIFLEQYINMRK